MRLVQCTKANSGISSTWVLQRSIFLSGRQLSHACAPRVTKCIRRASAVISVELRQPGVGSLKLGMCKLKQVFAPLARQSCLRLQIVHAAEHSNLSTKWGFSKKLCTPDRPGPWVQAVRCHEFFPCAQYVLLRFTATLHLCSQGLKNVWTLQDISTLGKQPDQPSKTTNRRRKIQSHVVERMGGPSEHGEGRHENPPPQRAYPRCDGDSKKQLCHRK